MGGATGPGARRRGQRGGAWNPGRIALSEALVECLKLSSDCRFDAYYLVAVKIDIANKNSFIASVAYQPLRLNVYKREHGLFPSSRLAMLTFEIDPAASTLRKQQ
jgi:hypothetical protein